MASTAARLARLVFGIAPRPGLRLWRQVALAAALAVSLAANGGPWMSPASCGAGGECLTSPARTAEQAADGVALPEPFTETAADDASDSADDPPLAAANVLLQPPVVRRVALNRVVPAPGAPHDDLLPDKTGPPRA